MNLFNVCTNVVVFGKINCSSSSSTSSSPDASSVLSHTLPALNYFIQTSSLWSSISGERDLNKCIILVGVYKTINVIYILLLKC